MNRSGNQEIVNVNKFKASNEWKITCLQNGERECVLMKELIKNGYVKRSHIIGSLFFQISVIC